MKKQMIFFDIDGTLLNHDKKLPESTRKAIHRLKELGHELAAQVLVVTDNGPAIKERIRNFVCEASWLM